MSFKDRKRVQHAPPVDDLEKHTGMSVTEFKEKVAEMVKDIPGAKIVDEVQKEEIEPLVIRERKKREDRKDVNNVGLVGDTTEAKDFRAICKKAGLQINVTLTEIIRDWNMAHYNL